MIREGKRESRETHDCKAVKAFGMKKSCMKVGQAFPFNS